MNTIPIPSLTLLAASPLTSTFTFVVFLGLSCFVSIFRHRARPTTQRIRRASAGTPPCSISPSTHDGKDRQDPQRGRSSLVSFVAATLLPKRAPECVSSGTDGLPVTDRTDADICAFGDFPDYAALSGVRLPEAYVNFEIERALPRPYRPFRWAYHQTMSFKKMEPDWWLELENTYKERITQRLGLYQRHGSGVLQTLPGSEAVCKELMEMCLQFLAARYPQYFVLSHEADEEADGNKKWAFENKILNTKTWVHDKQPLVVVLENIPEDFAIMLRNPDDGLYEFRAGVICSSLGWNVASKIGMKLHEIHEPIPDYREKMQMSMDRYFTKMPASSPIQRGSWGLEYLQPLYMPPNDPHAAHRLTQSPTLQLSDINLRVDWQTLRRLPLSGGIVFNFKALFTPITQFSDEPGVPAVVLEVLNHGKKSLMDYKSTWHVEHVAKPALEAWDRQQREDGVVGKDWVVETLDEYPMFRGWREKWVRLQGFE